MKKLVLAVGMVIACGAGYWLWIGPSTDRASSPETRRSTVALGDLHVVVSATGEIKPVRSIEIKSKASGQVRRFSKRAGEPVDEGEIIAELDPTIEQHSVEREEATLKSAEAQLLIVKAEAQKAEVQARSELDAALADLAAKKTEAERLEKLDRGLATEREIAAALLNVKLAEERKTQVEANVEFVRSKRTGDEKSAEAAVTLARLTLEDARERLRDTKLRSPISGIVLRKSVEEGQIVSSGISTAGGGTSIAVLADVSTLIVEANIDETDIGKIRTGQKAIITADAHADKLFQGEVALIPPQGDLDSNIIVYKVQVVVRGKDLMLLKSGMTANVDIHVESKQGIPWVPIEALRQDREGMYVTTSAGPVHIKTGLDTGTQVEIIEGVKAGAEILIPTTPAANEGGRPAGPGRRIFRW